MEYRGACSITRHYKDVVHAALDRVKKEVLDSLATASTTRRITVEAVADTSPAEAIAKYAATHGADLIVMGAPRIGRIARHARLGKLRRAPQRRNARAHREVAHDLPI